MPSRTRTSESEFHQAPAVQSWHKQLTISQISYKIEAELLAVRRLLHEDQTESVRLITLCIPASPSTQPIESAACSTPLACPKIFAGAKIIKNVVLVEIF